MDNNNNNNNKGQKEATNILTQDSKYESQDLKWCYAKPFYISR